jgi:hypothetical protein
MIEETCGGCYWTTGSIDHATGHRRRFCEMKGELVDMRGPACDQFREDQSGKQEKYVKEEAQELKRQQAGQAKFKTEHRLKRLSVIAAIIVALIALIKFLIEIL